MNRRTSGKGAGLHAAASERGSSCVLDAAEGALFQQTLVTFLTSRGIPVRMPRPARQPQPCRIPAPQPGWRYLRLIDPPQITTARWEALSRSQIRAARLIRAGSSENALQALREGTWHNPEEELRKLLVRFTRQRRPRQSANQAKEAA